MVPLIRHNALPGQEKLLADRIYSPENNKLMGAALMVIKILIATPFAAYGQQVYQIQVKEPLKVFKAPSKKSKELRTLNPGQVVTTSPRAQNGFYRATLHLSRGRRLSGYIAADSMKRSRLHLSRAPAEADKTGQRSSSWRLGAGLIATYLRQGESTYQLNDGSTYELTAFQSSSLNAGFFADYRHSTDLGLRFGIHQRQARFAGEARLKNSMGPSSSPIASIRSHQFLSLSAVVQRYLQNSPSLWWGGGGELSLGQKLSLNLNGSEAATSREDIPHYGLIFAALGVEAPLKKKLFWTPDIRVGAVVTTSPLIFYGEANLVLSYQF